MSKNVEKKEENKPETKVALVTGASRGLGYLIANTLLSNGYIVYGGVRKVSDDKEKFKFNQILLDVTKKDQIKDAVAAIIKKEKTIDVLINNAGIGGSLETVENSEMEQYRKIMEVNYFGLIMVTKEVLPYIIKENKVTNIINISSCISLVSPPLFSAYTASKAAVDRFTESLKAELSYTKVQVNIVSPGPSKTEFDGALYNKLGGQDKKYGLILKNFGGNGVWFGKKNITVPPQSVADSCLSILKGNEKDFRVYPDCSKNVVNIVLGKNYNDNFNQNVKFGKALGSENGYKDLNWDKLAVEDEPKKDEKKK